MLNSTQNCMLALIIMMCLALSSQAFASDTKKDRIAAAKKYEKIVPVKGMLDSMLDELSKNPSLGLSNEDLNIIKSSMDANELRSEMLHIMSKHFTVAEIDALTDFYSTAEGQAILKKMPVYMSDFMPYMQQQVIKTIQHAQKQKALK